MATTALSQVLKNYGFANNLLSAGPTLPSSIATNPQASSSKSAISVATQVGLTPLTAYNMPGIMTKEGKEIAQKAAAEREAAEKAAGSQYVKSFDDMTEEEKRAARPWLYATSSGGAGGAAGAATPKLSQAEINKLGGNNWYDQYNQERMAKYDEYFNQAWNNVNAGSAAVSAKNNQYWDTLYSDKGDMSNRYSDLEAYNYSNPFTTEQGKSILERYDLAGLQGRDNAAAVGGGDNSGNIDSFAAANAMRQQASLRNLGEQSALAAHSRTVNDGRGILSDRSGYLQSIYNNMLNSINTDIAANRDSSTNYYNLLNQYNNTNNDYFSNNMGYEQQVYNQVEASKQAEFDREQKALSNQVDRDKIIAEYSGLIPANVMAYIMGQVDEYGNVRNMDFDYADSIKKIDKLLETETDPDKIENYNKMKQSLTYARDTKIASDPATYGQYARDLADSLTTVVPTQTAEAKKNSDANKTELYKFDKTLAFERERFASDDAYRNADLIWQKDYADMFFGLEYAKIKAEDGRLIQTLASQETVARISADTIKDTNMTQIQLQEKINEGNILIANINAATQNYATGSAERVALEQIKKNAEINNNTLIQANDHFYASLDEERAARIADDELAEKQLKIQLGIEPEWKSTMTISQVMSNIEAGVPASKLENEIKWHWEGTKTYTDLVNKNTYDNLYKSVSSGAKRFVASLESEYDTITPKQLKEAIIAASKQMDISNADIEAIYRCFDKMDPTAGFNSNELLKTYTNYGQGAGLVLSIK